MTFSEKAARTVREFIRTATADEVVALARQASPHLFPATENGAAKAARPRATKALAAKPRKRNGHRPPK